MIYIYLKVKASHIITLFFFHMKAMMTFVVKGMEFYILTALIFLLFFLI